jgi:hypothetical protein
MTIRMAECHPDRPHHGLGLCSSCHSTRHRAEHRAGVAPQPRRKTALELVQRAERMKAELEAAEGYATMPATWEAIAEYLGGKPATLDRYRIRVRQYEEYGQQRQAVAG